MRDIAIYGAGGLGREVACLIRIINDSLPADAEKWNLIGFFDDGKAIGERNEYGEILGGMEILNKWSKKLSIAIAIGLPKHLKKISESITNPLIDFPNLIVPNVIFFDKDNMTIGKGNIISLNCTVSCNVSIGNFNFFNGFISIGHDAKIGNFNAVMPGVRISGNVDIGDVNLIGMESVIIQGKKIGNETVVGSNSVIVRNTKDGFTYVGNPAKAISF